MPRIPMDSSLSLAQSALRVAESRSLEALGDACRHAIGHVTGYSTYGLYWLDEGPQLFSSAGVPDGFDDDYRTGLARCDPFIDSVLGNGRVVDGFSLIGPHGWRRSMAYDLLHHWGLSYNMCGPLRLEQRIVGVFYTGTPDRDAPFGDAHRERLTLLCRAGSVALTNIARAGAFDEKGGPFARATPRARATAPDSPPATQTMTDRIDDMLPPRAAGVARLLCRGLSNKEIARAMGISDQTVKDHVASLCRRFGAANRTDLAARLQAQSTSKTS